MDFFQHQERARKNTAWLVFLFFSAVVGMILVTYFIVAWAFASSSKGYEIQSEDLWNTVLFVWVAIITLLVVGGASLFKIMQLKGGGGAYVAESLGGRLLDPAAKKTDEQKILNVVEEIAIAAGIPTPKVYLLDKEEGMNAFAAGYSSSNAVIGVTRGLVESLNRDELQGVVAHEFSHILNGDMRINIRLMGILFGILALGLIGYYTLRSSMFTAGSSRQRGSAGFVLVTVGLGLMAVGFIGTFFGHLIKAAVSRQREFLADASAVQFTRNPGGIGNALRKIRDHQFGSKVINPRASEVSHMFFATGALSAMASLFATHPPIDERITRIFSLEKTESKKLPPVPKISKKEPEAEEPSLTFVDSTGKPNVDQIRLAKTLIAALPLPVKGAIHDLFGARAIVYGLLLSKDPEIRKIQHDKLSEESYLGVYRELNRLLPDIDKIEMKARIPMIDMAIRTLNSLTKSQYEVFRENVKNLIFADKKIDIFEWILEKVLIDHLDGRFRRARKAAGRKKLKDHLRESYLLLKVLSFVGNKNPKQHLEALNAGLKKIGVKPLSQMKKVEIRWEDVDNALDSLVLLKPQDKKKLLEGCLASIQHDKKITLYEAELFRAIGDALGCPVPLILPD